jgi:outer membrane protein TolC
MMQKYLYFYLSCGILLLIPPTLHAEQADTEKLQLSLSQAIEQALENNLNLRLKQDDVKLAEGDAQKAQARFDTFLSAEASAASKEMTPLFQRGAKEEDSSKFNGKIQKRFTTGTEIDLGIQNGRFKNDTEGILFDPAYSSTLSLSVSQPLLKGWGTDIQMAEIQAAEKQLQAFTYLVDSQAADLAALVKKAYWNLVFAWQDIKVQKLSLTLANTLLEETGEKINAGKLAPVEIYQPQSEVARREETLIASERAIGVADDELKLLLNSRDWLATFDPTEKPDTTPVQLDQAVILSNALTNRPDVKAADLQVDAAKISTRLAEDNIRPSLALVGMVGYGGTDDAYNEALEAAFDNTDTEWQIGLNFSIPLANDAAKGTLTRAMAAHNKAITNARLLRLRVKKAVRTTVRDVHLAIKAMEATRKTSLATLKRLEAEQAKFEAGRSTTLDVLIAQDAYSQALSQENRTNIVYVQSLAEIDRIQGLITISSTH